jgi:hypothetical protein
MPLAHAAQVSSVSVAARSDRAPDHTLRQEASQGVLDATGAQLTA